MRPPHGYVRLSVEGRVADPNKRALTRGIALLKNHVIFNEVGGSWESDDQHQHPQKGNPHQSKLKSIDQILLQNWQLQNLGSNRLLRARRPSAIALAILSTLSLRMHNKMCPYCYSGGRARPAAPCCDAFGLLLMVMCRATGLSRVPVRSRLTTRSLADARAHCPRTRAACLLHARTRAADLAAPALHAGFFPARSSPFGERAGKNPACNEVDCNCKPSTCGRLWITRTAPCWRRPQ